MANEEAGFAIAELLQGVIEAMVDTPEAVEVRAAWGNRGVVLHASVAPSDMGKVVGKHGKNAKALRTILLAMSRKAGAICELDLAEYAREMEAVAR